MRPAVLLLAVVLAAGSLCASVLADSDSAKLLWPQWRGPQRDGQLPGPAWPDSLSGEKLRQTWRVELGPSYSGPIVTADRVFVTETVDKETEVTRALERETGKQIWEARWPGAMSVPFFAASNGSWIRATPACDGNRLYVAGMRDVLACLDTATGEELWRVDFVEQLETPLPSFGFASSPLVVGDFVYVQAGGGFIKLDKLTGKVIWRTLTDGGGMFGSAFSSPFFATIGETPQLLVQTRTKLTGVDPEQGTVLWEQEIPAFRGMNILTPTVSGNRVFTSSYGGKSFLFRVERAGDAWQVKEEWVNRFQGYMSSPVLIDGHLYLHMKNQRFACIDLSSGEERWVTEPFGKYWSMVANGKKILALDQRGELLLIRANPERFELLDSRKVADDSWAHLAISDGEVFIRELNAMAAYKWNE
jgi:outer membrane protein assembly factor BamB